MNKIFLDTETTGLDSRFHAVWEIAYAVNDGPILDSIVPHTLENAVEQALEINGYHERINSRGDVDDEVAFELQFIKELEGNIIVAANPAFDSKMLKARFGRELWHYRMIDLETYAMPALDLDEPRGLAFIAEQLGVKAPDHTAAADVFTLRECFYKLQDFYKNYLHY